MNKRHLADSLSLSRIIFGILFAYGVFYLNSNLFVILVIYFLAVLSDVSDGRIARRYKIDNKIKGAKVDVLSDFAFIIVKLFCIMLCKFTAILVFNCNNLEINRVFQNKL